MKHIVIIAIALISFSVNAQQETDKQKERTHRMHDFTPEQIAELKTKRMALNLNLDEAQQQKIQKLNLEAAKQRQSKRLEKEKRRNTNSERPSSDELFKMKSERLDKALAHKKEMKTILNEEQFEK